MKKGILIALLIALILIIAGAAMLALSYKKGDWKNYMRTEKTTRTVDVAEAFESVYVDGESCSVQLLPAENGKASVTVDETEKLNFTVEVKNGVLEIVQHDTSKWYERIFNFDLTGYKAVIRLPESVYTSIELKTVSGSISSVSPLTCGTLKTDSTSGSLELANASCVSLNCSCVSGSVKAENVNCSEAFFHTTSGSVKLNDVIADGKMEVSVTSGSIRFERVDAADIHMHTVSGSIKGSVRTAKQFSASTVSGSKSVPANGEGGVFKAETTSGSIEITIAE